MVDVLPPKSLAPRKARWLPHHRAIILFCAWHYLFLMKTGVRLRGRRAPCGRAGPEIEASSGANVGLAVPGAVSVC
jgi:hypothetical protein